MALRSRPALKAHTVAAASLAIGAALLLATLALGGIPDLSNAERGRRGLRQDNSASSQLPTECINTGLNLQELEMASKAFGLSPTSDVSNIKVNISELQDYLAKAPAPSSECCAAALSFNNAYCSCSPAVLDLVKSFTNNDINQYNEVAKYLATRCQSTGKPYTLYLGSTCPK